MGRSLPLRSRAVHGGGRLLHQGVQLFQSPLFDAGYIAAGDPERGGHLPLGQGDGTAQPIAQADDLRFPGGKALRHQPVQLPGAVPVVKIVQHGVVHAHHVQ